MKGFVWQLLSFLGIWSGLSYVVHHHTSSGPADPLVPPCAVVCALLLHCVSLITNGAWMHFSCWSALINIQRWQVDICKEDLHWPSCCASVRLPYSALCWMLLRVLPRDCICVSKGTDCSVTLCCCQECRQCVWMSLHPSARSRTGCCRASIHPGEQDWRVLGLYLWLLVEVCYVGTGALMEDSFMPMTRLLPFPGSCLGKQ